MWNPTLDSGVVGDEQAQAARELDDHPRAPRGFELDFHETHVGDVPGLSPCPGFLVFVHPAKISGARPSRLGGGFKDAYIQHPTIMNYDVVRRVVDI